MAFNKLIGFAILAIILPTVAMATEYVVGDDQGWKLAVNYTEWAKGKVFHVGDKLVFTYQPPHNVYKVDGNGFEDCVPSQNLFKSGNDTITLSQPGKKWYICGFADHCAKGQKLVINVESNGPMPAPAPVPEPASNDSDKFISSWYQIFVLVVAVMAVIGA